MKPSAKRALATTACCLILGAAGATDLDPVGGIGGFSSTSEYKCRVQPESFEKALLGHQLAVAQMFGEKMRNSGQ